MQFGMNNMPKLSRKITEPSILVRPVSRFGGLDNIHIALIALVIILILLLLEVSYTTKISVNVTCQNCTAAANATNYTAGAQHTPAQVKLQAEKILAGYTALNSSLSLLPYIADVNEASVSYLKNYGEWYVSIPYTGPLTGNTYLFSLEINDSNMTKFSALAQVTAQPKISKNYVVSPGVIKLYGQTACTPAGSPLLVYWFMDPYAPGAVQSLVNETGLQKKFGGNVNVSIKILTTQYSDSVAKVYGMNNTLQLGKYLLCASGKPGFGNFVKELNATYQGNYVPPYVLQELAGQAGLNVSSVESCVSSSQGAINGQFVEAEHYNITSSSSVLTNCEFLSIPETAYNAICYSDSSIC